MGEIVLFTADLHGNKIQYERLFKYARAQGASAVIIGGDITPKDSQYRTVELQKRFLSHYLIPRVTTFREEAPGCEVFLIMGNDDLKVNYGFLTSNQGSYRVLTSLPTPWNHYQLCGYSYVPYTPFSYKDWERADLIEKHEDSRKDIVLTGVLSTDQGFVEHTISLDQRADSIEKDLRTMLETLYPETVILVTHTPPYNTSLDVLSDNRHVGSEAVRKIIEEKQPFLTLHGHIHECVINSGRFMDTIGRTVSVAAGNHHLTDTLALIKIDMSNPQGAQRII